MMEAFRPVVGEEWVSRFSARALERGRMIPGTRSGN
jgi:hypothetical protein